MRQSGCGCDFDLRLLSSPAHAAGAAEEVGAARTPAGAAGATGRRASPSASGPTGAPSRPLTSGAKLLPTAAKPSARARTQSAAVQAVFGLVRGLRFEHQLGNVDVRVALVAAHLAVDAQVGDRLHLVGRRDVRRRRGRGAGSPWPAGSRPRAGGAEHGTHPLRRGRASGSRRSRYSARPLAAGVESFHTRREIRGRSLESGDTSSLRCSVS